ncbi:hypothetical protein BN1708_007791 [Verticillium longisporum]|uniref:Uncharacterized protein n=1 Tax=Verticillium longisporum TaxID=100787 RepID=A0A0G4MWE8_VERLO|nr:hypothetical protein BN1708_007791 [Verticillium longisporum]
MAKGTGEAHGSVLASLYYYRCNIRQGRAPQAGPSASGAVRAGDGTQCSSSLSLQCMSICFSPCHNRCRTRTQMPDNRFPRSASLASLVLDTRYGTDHKAQSTGHENVSNKWWPGRNAVPGILHIGSLRPIPQTSQLLPSAEIDSIRDPVRRAVRSVGKGHGPWPNFCNRALARFAHLAFQMINVNTSGLRTMPVNTAGCGCIQSQSARFSSPLIVLH